MKKFSIGSKKPTAKVISINLKPKHIWFGVVVFIISLVVHTFIWTPYFDPVYKVQCSDSEIYDIVDNMTSVCGVTIPYGLDREQISDYIRYNYFGSVQDDFINFNITQ